MADASRESDRREPTDLVDYNTGQELAERGHGVSPVPGLIFKCIDRGFPAVTPRLASGIAYAISLPLRGRENF